LPSLKTPNVPIDKTAYSSQATGISAWVRKAGFCAVYYLGNIGADYPCFHARQQP